MTTKEARPSTRREETSGTAAREQAATPGPRAAPQQSPITLRMRNAGLAWDELNSMPSTPPPQSFDRSAPEPGRSARSGRRHTLVIATAAVVIGLGVVVGVAELGKRHPNSVPAPNPQQVIPSAREKPAELVHTATPAPDVVPLGQPPEKPPTKASAQPGATPPVPETSRTTGKRGQPDLRLRKREPLTSRSHRSSPRPAEPAPEQRGEVVPAAKPAAAQVEEFGMDLTPPKAKHRTKMMDEKDPYVP